MARDEGIRWHKSRQRPSAVVVDPAKTFDCRGPDNRYAQKFPISRGQTLQTPDPDFSHKIDTVTPIPKSNFDVFPRPFTPPFAPDDSFFFLLLKQICPVYVVVEAPFSIRRARDRMKAVKVIARSFAPWVLQHLLNVQPLFNVSVEHSLDEIYILIAQDPWNSQFMVDNLVETIVWIFLVYDGIK